MEDNGVKVREAKEESQVKKSGSKVKELLNRGNSQQYIIF